METKTKKKQIYIKKKAAKLYKENEHGDTKRLIILGIK